MARGAGRGNCFGRLARAGEGARLRLFQKLRSEHETFDFLCAAFDFLLIVGEADVLNQCPSF